MLDEDARKTTLLSVPFFAVFFTVGMFGVWSLAMGFYGVRYVRGGLAATRAGVPFEFSGADGRGMLGKRVSGTTAVVIGVALLAFAIGSFVAGIALGALLRAAPPIAS